MMDSTGTGFLIFSVPLKGVEAAGSSEKFRMRVRAGAELSSAGVVVGWVDCG